MKIVNLDALRGQRRQGNHETKVLYVVDGKQYEATKSIVNGEMQLFELGKPIGEMLTTAAVRKELIEKVVLDVELGREDVPLLYTDIYERREDRNFPEIFDAKWAQYGVVVFMEHSELEEVKFGHLQAEQGPVARIITNAAGIEYTEDMVEYNKTFEMEELDRAFGEGHNALLNHMHLYPIFSYSYHADNKTAVVYVDAEGKVLANGTGAHPVLSMRATLRAGISAAAVKKRPGTILLCSNARLEHIKEAMAAMYVRGTDYASVTGISTIVAYDGWDIKVGKKSFNYAGVPSDKAYLIRPKRGFKELVKHDLRIDANIGDLSRLVEAQIVGRSRRGVFAALAENVQEITLPQ